MYVTTYPCHNCARHIIAAGVIRVGFIATETLFASEIVGFLQDQE